MTEVPPRPLARSDNAPTVAEVVGGVISRHRALMTLRFLAGPLKGSGNDLLPADLLDRIGVSASRAAVEQTIRLLERLRAVDVESREGLLVLRLLSLGSEIAHGLERRDEVEPPGPDMPF